MALGGAQTVTCYETTGWRGVMETEASSPIPEKFHSIPGGVFPVYHVLADVAEFAGGEVLSTGSDDTLKVQGLALRKDGRIRLLAANLSPAAQTITLSGLPAAAALAVLDETTALEAAQSPEAFHARRRKEHSTNSLHLLPYAVATLDYVTV
jgi:hypothetical protein